MNKILIATILAISTAPSIAQESFPREITRNNFPEIRTIDGRGNNLNTSELGMANTPLIRKSPARYEDTLESPSGANRPNPRYISNNIHTQRESTPNKKGASDFLWIWGQFIDHDFGLTEPHHNAEPMPIIVPNGDPQFIPSFDSETAIINMSRSNYTYDQIGIRQQMNQITSFIDGSNIYGSDENRAYYLRALDGSGRLKTTSGGFLPLNDAGFANAPSADRRDLYLAGDIRANEQIGLLAMHTIFVREHNHIADMIRQEYIGMSGQQVYQLARAIVGAEIQKITYDDFLPVLLGDFPEYRGYNPNVNPSLMNEFSSVAFRVGHTMLSSHLTLIDENLESIGSLKLRDVFFNPDLIRNNQMIENLFRGFSRNTAQDIDPLVVDDVRNFLFGRPGSGGFDLASLNIQRGRDHGIGNYRDIRNAFGLSRITDFPQITQNNAMAERLSEVFSTLDQLDPWTALLAEDHYKDAIVGETLYTIIKEQFIALRDGDRFWYENTLNTKWLDWVNKQSLKSIIVRNTEVESNHISENVFLVNQRNITEPKKLVGLYNTICLMTGGSVDCENSNNSRIQFPREIVNPKDTAVTQDAACVLDEIGITCGTAGGDSPVRYGIPRGKRFSKIWGGDNSMCAGNDEQVVCWGYGLGTFNVPNISYIFPHRVFSRNQYTALSAGQAMTIGSNFAGSNQTIRNLDYWQNAVELAKSDFDTCAIENNQASCVSANFPGSARIISNLNNPHEVTMAGSLACVLDGTTPKCWNNNHRAPQARAIGLTLNEGEKIAIRGDQLCYSNNDSYQCINI